MNLKDVNWCQTNSNQNWIYLDLPRWDMVRFLSSPNPKNCRRASVGLNWQQHPVAMGPGDFVAMSWAGIILLAVVVCCLNFVQLTFVFDRFRVGWHNLRVCSPISGVWAFCSGLALRYKERHLSMISKESEDVGRAGRASRLQKWMELSQKAREDLELPSAPHGPAAFHIGSISLLSNFEQLILIYFN